MIICSALYYPGSLENGDLIIRDNRFYPGKYSETFPVWWQYIRKHYPDINVFLFEDSASPVSVKTFIVGQDSKTVIIPVSAYVGQYFRPMQRNLVQAISLAYYLEEDLFWIDNDAFLNTDIRPLIGDADVINSNIEHHQQTMGSVCFYISRQRLHDLDQICNLPSYLNEMVNNGPEQIRMHSLQEGGLYKIFCYGKAKAIGSEINLTHLSCYDNFMKFLDHNPLDTDEYKYLIEKLKNFDFNRIPNVELKFHDMLYLK